MNHPVKNCYLHKEDSENMHPEDPMVVFKLSDMKEPIAGRYRRFIDEGRWTKPDMVYIHRGDGTILHKYNYGFDILKIIEI